MPRRRSLLGAVRQLNATGITKKGKPTNIGQVGFDNPRENIDHHVRTKALTTKEISGASLDVTDLKIKSGTIIDTPTANRHIANKAYVDASVLAEDFWNRDTTQGIVETKTDTDRISGANLTLSGSTLYTLDDGKVGIGTITPANLLHIKKSTGVAAAKIESDDDTANLTLNGVKTSDAVIGQINFLNAADSVASVDAYRTGANDAASLRFLTQTTGGSMTEKVRIDNVGKVGIGTTAPDGTLHVMTASAGAVTAQTSGDNFVVEGNGETGISILTPDANTGRIDFGSPSEDDYARIIGSYNAGSPTLTLRTVNGGASQMVLDNDGNVGIGTTTPSEKLEVVGTISGSNITIKNGSSPNSQAGEGRMFVSGGALFYIGSSGTLTQVASA